MVSRRKILSRSRDDLNLDQTFSPQEEEEDVWYQKDKLYKEHIQEVLDKWTQIDDEIWAKVIVFERNRRVAKAYARAPVLTINGSDDGFDGMRIGLCGFDNPMRDQKTEELKKHIGQGVKIKMDDAGNILIRRYAKSNVYIKSTASNQNEETSIGADILKLPNQALESEKIVKLFDMKKFQSNVNRELRRAYPDRRRLETQCLSAVAFVKSESDILECPIWVLIVNVVAMDMLKSKLPPVQRPLVDIKNRPRIPIPDEDPYSVAGNGSGGSSGSSGFGASAMSSMMSLQQQQQLIQQPSQTMTGNNSSNNNNNNSSSSSHITTNGNVSSSTNTLQHITNGTVAGLNGSGHVAAAREQLIMQSQQLAHKRSEKPPKLPPRDNIYGHDIPKPDYDDIDVDTRIKLSRGKSDKGKDNKKYDDPYYCGLRARVPNFVKTSSKTGKEQSALQNGSATQQQHMNTLTSQKKTSVMMPMHPTMHAPQPPHMHPHHIQQQQMMAAVAAHAAAQQHHPMHHHHAQHAAAAQQMWQTRSYESGIGIYNHKATTTTTTAATAATATNFNTDLQLQHHHHHHQQPLQQSQQQQQQQPLMQQQQQQQQQTASSNYYPSANAISPFYNYLSPNYQEHLHQQQQQQLANSSSTSNSNSLTTTSLSNASNFIQSTQSVPIGQMTNATNAIAPSASIQLNTNLTFATNPPIPIQAKTNHESLYGQTRNLNLKPIQTPPVPFHCSFHSKGHNDGGHQYHRHHSHHSHHRHQHHRSHHHGSYGCSVHSSHPSQRCTAADFYLHSPEPFYDDFHSRRSKHVRPSRRSSSTNTLIDNKCNCVSCYTLAPLFGAPTPRRPSRSLSQQQLRLHQRLSGAKNPYNNNLNRGGAVKWCSDSDVSLLGREEQEQSEGTDYYKTHANHKECYDDNIFDYDHFDLDHEFDIENFTLTQTDFKKQLQKPKAQKFNDYAARHKFPTINDSHHSFTDDYIDKARLRQIRSPTPQRKGSFQFKENQLRTPTKKSGTTNLLTMRTKSQSTESFFEQPHEEGTIYLYGGRKRIVKAPSTTSIYERVKNQREQAKKYNSQLNLHNDQRQMFQKTTEINDHDTLKPLVPAPLWRGAKRMNLKFSANQKFNTNKILDQNNKNFATNREDDKMCKLQKAEEEKIKMSANQNKDGLSINSNVNGNGKIITTFGTNYNNKQFTSNSNADKNNEKEKQQLQQQSQTQQLIKEKQQQLQLQPQPRIARSSSRVDFSDMESIYGYLKPRKPRSLSMKKIQILDY